jgi:hypothetical protein
MLTRSPRAGEDLIAWVEGGCEHEGSGFLLRGQKGNTSMLFGLRDKGADASTIGFCWWRAGGELRRKWPDLQEKKQTHGLTGRLA